MLGAEFTPFVLLLPSDASPLQEATDYTLRGPRFRERLLNVARIPDAIEKVVSEIIQRDALLCCVNGLSRRYPDVDRTVYSTLGINSLAVKGNFEFMPVGGTLSLSGSVRDVTE